ncbi:N-acetyl-gamma-glutamyl-phosphate reductase [Bacillus sp. A301a_S52]|nr:N-acetyl-gamma-glutamyl-phosphate reductase [Bacillus sp. A301a_S52]
MKQVAIVGGTGYGAIELIRLLQGHSKLQITKIISHSQEGQRLDEIYPHLKTFVPLPMEELNIHALDQEVDIVFFATPPGVSKQYIPHLQSVQCIDLSGDLRLDSPEKYETWYGQKAAPKSLLDEAVYGLSEIYSEKLATARICSNPGCFPTASLLGLIPAVHHDLIDLTSIVIDGKTGVSGAGRKQSPMTHFSETNENVKPYKVGKHQHIPEIEQYLTDQADQQAFINMTTHLIPMTRGLLCTMYAQLKNSVESSYIHELYSNYYQDHTFVRVRPESHFPSTKEVAGSNFCDIGIHINERTGQLMIASAIDNLVKGAAGQAIQNANIMNGWNVEEGLQLIPMFP